MGCQNVYAKKGLVDDHYSHTGKEISQDKLNLMKYKSIEVKLKEEMSLRWRQLGQNVGIGDAKLTGFEDKHQKDNEKCIDSVITEWIHKTSKMVCT